MMRRGIFIGIFLGALGFWLVRQLLAGDESKRSPAVAGLQRQLVDAQVQIRVLNQRLKALSGLGDADMAPEGAEAGSDMAAPAVPADEKADPPAADDLTKVQGIGPQIAEMLAQRGIHTYAHLANYTAEDLRTLLSEAGGRFRLADPETWPEQARYAAAGDWGGLDAYLMTLRSDNG